MPSLLASLRQKPSKLTPLRFLRWHPGAFIQYYDDTPAKDPAKAVSAPVFLPSFARQKQLQRCAVCFSLQAFAGKRTKEAVEAFRHLGVDVDLAPRGQHVPLSPADVELRKEEYLRRRLLPFPLKPHWLIETRGGFHALFRVRSVRDAAGIREALDVNRRLVSLLHGDERACLMTQVLRVPGTLQFKDPARPFLCGLLIDNSAAIAPYELPVVSSVLDAIAVFQGGGSAAHPVPGPRDGAEGRGRATWQEGLSGAPEGQRNATAASVIGGILCRLPEELFEVAGWGGLKEWNLRNAVPLPERELRVVFESIARRERVSRQREGGIARREVSPGVLVQVEIRVRRGEAEQVQKVEVREPTPRAAPGLLPPAGAC